MNSEPDPSSPDEIGVIIVDHGSKREESNNMLLEVVDAFRVCTDYSIVEPAHMEIAEPSIAIAFERCVQRGAQLVVIHPYFLLPGRHWDQDIPALAAAAAGGHPGIRYLVTAPLGIHALMGQIIGQRIDDCLNHARAGAEPCDVCAGTEKCQIREARA